MMADLDRGWAVEGSLRRFGFGGMGCFVGEDKEGRCRALNREVDPPPRGRGGFDVITTGVASLTASPGNSPGETHGSGKFAMSTNGRRGRDTLAIDEAVK